MEVRSKEFLDSYLGSLPQEKASQYSSFSADYYCADEYNANLCADLVLKEQKKATCSMEYWYSVEGEKMPEVGHLQVVTNWAGEPVCIIEVTSVKKCKFNEVTPDFAVAEGEGDKSLEWWRKAHWEFFF